MNHEEYLNTKSLEVVSKAIDLITGKGDYLTTIRQLSKLKLEVSEIDFDSDLTLFASIDSETDHIPVGEHRNSCSTIWLEECDKEIFKVKCFFQKDVEKVCKKLIKRFSVNP